MDRLVSCYFFTVEFGLCREGDKMKVYGAGLLSSAAELQHVMDRVEDCSMPLLALEPEPLFSAELMVTEYQKQYFYTDTIEEATAFVRSYAESIKRPFSVRYNPYTQTVEVLNDSSKILDMAKELRGDLAIVASALKKVQEREPGEIDPDTVTNYLTRGLDITPFGSTCTPPVHSPPLQASPTNESCDSFLAPPPINNRITIRVPHK